MELSNNLDDVSLIDNFDRQHLWHPYTSATDPLPAFKVSRAHGRTLVLSDGTELLDAMSSWWCCVHGYNIPQINAALTEQVQKLAHVMFAGLTHQPAIDLGKRLLSLLPSNLQHIFYADSGSVATEVAMKMAIQYQRACGQRQKTSFVTIHSGYHGDTWNAMSVCEPAGMHTVFGDILPSRFFAQNPQTPFPNSIISASSNPQPCCIGDVKADTSFNAQDLQDLESIFAQHHEHIAALILEPIVQGAGGMYFYHPEFLNQAHALCQKYGALLIVDEIATGFGRTGKLFAIDYTKVTPDIMLLGKGLTAGYMTLSAAVCSEHVAQIISKAEPHAFMHGPTFMANPLACAVACASLDYLLSYNCQEQAAMIEQGFRTGLRSVAHYSCVKQVRALGAIGVIEMRNKIDVAAVEQECLNLGVWLRPMGNLLYAMPPLTTTPSELEQMLNAMVVIASKIEQHSLAQAQIGGASAEPAP